MKCHATRDKVVTITDEGKELVGVNFTDSEGTTKFLELEPNKADKLIDIWGRSDITFGALRAVARLVKNYGGTEDES